MATDTEDKIGNYKYIRILHQGQNSTVMEVAQDGSGKHFVLKQLLPTKAGDPVERKLFEFEAKLGQELRHPNMIKVHEYVKDRKQPYFVMDYFPSSTHLRLFVGKPAQFEWVRPKLHWIIEQSGQALAYMHDKGWVHRDLKPENLIINKVGETRLIDYALAMKPVTGLGKLFAKKPPRSGTHSYMSPEQILRLPVQPASDIYSFGTTCYELACGRQPFRANSTTELLNKHIKDTPSPPTSHNKNITPEFADLVMKMLKKKPKDRLPSIRDFLAQFSRIRIYKDDPPPAPPRY